eukprot:2033498-Pyramimonas_sp.AAC.1
MRICGPGPVGPGVSCQMPPPWGCSGLPLARMNPQELLVTDWQLDVIKGNAAVDIWAREGGGAGLGVRAGWGDPSDGSDRCRFQPVVATRQTSAS